MTKKEKEKETENAFVDAFRKAVEKTEPQQPPVEVHCPHCGQMRLSGFVSWIMHLEECGKDEIPYDAGL